MPIFRQPLQRISRDRHPCAMSQLPCSMLRALLLLACTAKVAAFAQTPPGCVDVAPDGLRSAYTGDPAETLAMVFEDLPNEEVPIASCADVAAGGGCDDESLAGFCCASCALPQRMTYASRRRRLFIGVIIATSGCSKSSEGSEDRGC